MSISPIFSDAQHRAGRVLIIEDDDGMRRLQTFALQHLGWVVSQAATGSEGLAAAAETLPEVIICDRRLPDLDGIDVIAALALDPSIASIPVVLVTSLGEAEEIVRGIDAGAHDYLVKPFQMIELGVRCRAALRMSRQHRALTVAEERWRTAFELAPVGMAEVGIDGRFLRVNIALCDIVGYSAEQLHAMTPVDISHPDDAQRARQAIAEVAAHNVGRFRDEKRYVHADGHIIWCAASGVPVFDVDGRVNHLLVYYLDISELKRIETELEHLAAPDSLTGLLNRRGFDEALRRHVAHVNRYGPDGALIIVDLDRLKAVNDTEGHDSGDRAIVSVADILRRRLRGTDTIARLGGDEFAVILAHVDRDQAGRVAAQLVDRIRHRSASDAPTPAMTASLGVAMFDRPCRSAEDVLSDADRAMYAAKSAGGDRYAFSGPGTELDARQPGAS